MKVSITHPSTIDRALVCLRTLDRFGPMTVNEFCTWGGRDLYVNTWAPIFTHLKDEGLVERTGERRRTSHGAMAWVLRITAGGRECLAAHP